MALFLLTVFKYIYSNKQLYDLRYQGGSRLHRLDRKGFSGPRRVGFQARLPASELKLPGWG
jgi:hypothetical protein